MKLNQMRLKWNLCATNRCRLSAGVCDGLGRGRGIIVRDGQSLAFRVLSREGEINCPRPGRTSATQITLNRQVPSPPPPRPPGPAGWDGLLVGCFLSS